jgi:hypothetical protein
LNIRLFSQKHIGRVIIGCAHDGGWESDCKAIMYTLKVNVEVLLNKHENTYAPGPFSKIDPDQMQVFAARKVVGDDDGFPDVAMSGWLYMTHEPSTGKKHCAIRKQ